MNDVRFKVLLAVLLRILVFWDVNLSLYQRSTYHMGLRIFNRLPACSVKDIPHNLNYV